MTDETHETTLHEERLAREIWLAGQRQRFLDVCQRMNQAAILFEQGLVEPLEEERGVVAGIPDMPINLRMRLSPVMRVRARAAHLDQDTALTVLLAHVRTPAMLN